MIKKILLAASLVFTLVSVAEAQDENVRQRRRGRPNIPGTFLIEVGVNRPFNRPDNFDLGLWGSRTLNLYYQHDVRILQSKFSFHPGVGFGLDRYKFRNEFVIQRDAAGNTALGPAAAQIDVQKSQLITNYVDVPLEIRFSGNPNDPARSFKASLGVRGGVLFDSSRKIKYNEDGEGKILKDKQMYNLNRFRYGMYAKVGVGNFAVFGYYNVSPLFESGRGPGGVDINALTVGISLAGF